MVMIPMVLIPGSIIKRFRTKDGLKSRESGFKANQKSKLFPTPTPNVPITIRGLALLLQLGPDFQEVTVGQSKFGNTATSYLSSLHSSIHLSLKYSPKLL